MFSSSCRNDERMDQSAIDESYFIIMMSAYNFVVACMLNNFSITCAGLDSKTFAMVKLFAHNGWSKLSLRYRHFSAKYHIPVW